MRKCNSGTFGGSTWAKGQPLFWSPYMVKVTQKGHSVAIYDKSDTIGAFGRHIWVKRHKTRSTGSPYVGYGLSSGDIRSPYVRNGHISPDTRSPYVHNGHIRRDIQSPYVRNGHISRDIQSPYVGNAYSSRDIWSPYVGNGYSSRDIWSPDVGNGRHTWVNVTVH